MVYDCFTFFNELDLLDIRLHELNDFIDKFVIVESTVTFTNKKKPLFFELNKSRFESFKKKIIHIIVSDSPNVFGVPWIIEEHQFNSISRGLKTCQKNDLILLSSVDEIPNKEIAKKWISKPGKLKVFNQSLFYYYLNCKALNQSWLGTRMIKYLDLKKYPSAYIARYSPADCEIPNGGWHFSYVGGVKKIREKIFAFSHQEYNNAKFNTPEKIRLALQENSDLFGRNIEFRIVNNEGLPGYVTNNVKLFSNLLSQKKKKPKLIFLSYLNNLGRIKNLFSRIQNLFNA